MLLAEELLLVGLDPVRGRPAAMPRPLHTALAGALVTDLELAGLVTPGNDRIAVVAGGSATPPLLADTIAALPGNVRSPWYSRPSDRAMITSWLNGLDSDIGLYRRLASGLADAGVLGVRSHRFLYDSYPLLRPEVYDDAVDRLRAAARGGGELDRRTAALLALAGLAGLLKLIAPDRADRPHARGRIRLAIEMTPVAPAVEGAIGGQD